MKRKTPETKSGWLAVTGYQSDAGYPENRNKSKLIENLLGNAASVDDQRPRTIKLMHTRRLTDLAAGPEAVR